MNSCRRYIRNKSTYEEEDEDMTRSRENRTREWVEGATCVEKFYMPTEVRSLVRKEIGQGGA